MSEWTPQHETIWVALGNDRFNTLIGVASSYEAVNLLGSDWSKTTGVTHYLREYAQKQEDHEPELPNVLEINGNLYHKG